jgi:hypothetical protein
MGSFVAMRPATTWPGGVFDGSLDIHLQATAIRRRNGADIAGLPSGFAIKGGLFGNDLNPIAGGRRINRLAVLDQQHDGAVGRQIVVSLEFRLEPLGRKRPIGLTGRRKGRHRS